MRRGVKKRDSRVECVRTAAAASAPTSETTSTTVSTASVPDPVRARCSASHLGTSLGVSASVPLLPAGLVGGGGARSGRGAKGPRLGMGGGAPMPPADPAAAHDITHLSQTLIELQRELLSLAADADDEGTASQVGDYIREQEKTIWMLNAYLG